MKRFFSCVLCVALIAAVLLPLNVFAAKEPKVVRRALIAGRSSRVDRPMFRADALPTVKPELKAIKVAFSKNRFATKPAKITSEILLNAPKAKLQKRIAKKFKAATENDISYFYFSSHGAISGGQYYILPCLGDPVTATELRGWLDAIPGKIVLILNACFSGAAIDKSAAPQGDFAQGFTNAFLSAGAGKKAAFEGDKYIVITSASRTQSAWTGYGIDMFGYTFGAFVGWDSLERKRSFATEIMDETGGITLTALGPYLQAGVQALIDYFNDLDPYDEDMPPQTVCYAPSASDLVIFGVQ